MLKLNENNSNSFTVFASGYYAIIFDLFDHLNKPYTLDFHTNISST